LLLRCSVAVWSIRSPGGHFSAFCFPAGLFSAPQAVGNIVVWRLGAARCTVVGFACPDVLLLLGRVLLLLRGFPEHYQSLLPLLQGSEVLALYGRVTTLMGSLLIVRSITS
jgi:hypothetical protein